ncbi:hypothetical protein FS749_013385 [Ceratobasidium sp. UAMH 11750]|nr:hypothetical protein FS749_013385 [Ceratobasidium sp. UAMH 11750]
MLGTHFIEKGVFNTVWQVIWASATPPLAITIIPMINQFVASSPVDPLTIFPIAMTGKFFVLSLMISLVGRGYIRESFDQLARDTDPRDLAVEHAEWVTPVPPHESPVVYELDAIRQSISHPPRGAATLGASQLQPKQGGPNSFTESSSGHSGPKIDA